MVHEYARRLPKGINVVSFNPGLVPGTSLARSANAISRFMMGRVMALTSLTTNQKDAGRNLADVVLGATKVPTGSFVDRAKVDQSSEESYDRDREGELWGAVISSRRCDLI